jgi:hypothetical protein
MKKAKIMLASVAVLAIVGGALAFKAKSFIRDLYCTPTTFRMCHDLISTSLFDANIEGEIKYCNTLTYFHVCTTQVLPTTVVVE